MASVSNRNFHNIRRRRIQRNRRLNLINNAATLRRMQQMPLQNTDNEFAKILFNGCSFY
jgi:hypothetical protein